MTYFFLLCAICPAMLAVSSLSLFLLLMYRDKQREKRKNAAKEAISGDLPIAEGNPFWNLEELEKASKRQRDWFFKGMQAEHCPCCLERRHDNEDTKPIPAAFLEWGQDNEARNIENDLAWQHSLNSPEETSE